MRPATENIGFVFQMAWRDSRSSRWRLLFFSMSISLGVAALIAIGLFRASLARAIDDPAFGTRIRATATAVAAEGAR